MNMCSKMRLGLGVLLAVSALSVPACSGGAKYKVEDVVLSDVPVSLKQRMLAAEGEMNRAAELKNKAEADVAIAERDVAVAETERSQAKMEEDKIEANLRLAERGKDLNRIQAVKAQFSATNNARSSSEAKVQWLKSRRDHSRTVVQAAELRKTAAQRDYELEKARLVQDTGKRPSSGFSVAQFEQQATQAHREYDEAKAAADKQGTEASQLEQKYAQISGRTP